MATKRSSAVNPNDIIKDKLNVHLKTWCNNNPRPVDPRTLSGLKDKFGLAVNKVLKRSLSIKKYGSGNIKHNSEDRISSDTTKGHPIKKPRLLESGSPKSKSTSELPIIILQPDKKKKNENLETQSRFPEKLSQIRGKLGRLPEKHHQIAEKLNQIVEKHKQIAEKHKQIAEKHNQVAENCKQIPEKNNQSPEKQNKKNAVAAKSSRTCDICLADNFNTEAESKSHRETHFKCLRPFCRRFFSTQQEVERHMSNCGPKLPTLNTTQTQQPSGSLCVFCTGAQTFPDLRAHMMTCHKNSLVFVCTCENIFIGLTTYQDHARGCSLRNLRSTAVPINTVLYACELCEDFETNLKKELFRHKQSAHSSATTTVFTTPLPINLESSTIAEHTITLPVNLESANLESAESTTRLPIDRESSPALLIAKNETLATLELIKDETDLAISPASVVLSTSLNCPNQNIPILLENSQDCKPVKIEVQKLADFADEENAICAKCEKKFNSQAELELHLVGCVNVGKSSLLHHDYEYNIEEKDSVFLLGI